jgi:hypothetical protein
MNNLKNVDSIPDPRKKKGEDDSVNPDKFQKALKVEKSEETDKREKRNRPKKEEELDDEVDDVGTSIPIPTGLFKEYMTGDEKKASILDVSAGSKPHMVADSRAASSTPLGYIPEVKEGAASSKLSVGVTDETSSAANPAENDDNDDLLSSSSGLGSDDSEESIANNNSPSPAAAPPEATPAPQQQQNITQKAPAPPQEGNQEEVPDTESSNNDTTASSSNSQPQSEASKNSRKQKTEKKELKTVTKKKAVKTTKQDAKALNAKGKEPETPTLEKKTTAAKEVSGTKEAIQEPAKMKAKKALEKPHEIKDEKNIHIGTTKNADRKDLKETAAVKEKSDKSDDDMAISGIGALSDKGHDHKDDGSNKEGDDEEIIGVGAPAGPSPVGVPALKMSPFANIPKDVFELFEKMVGMMQVSKDNGKSITTVKLNMPGSTFDKCELILEHYDTAPSNYNVQFLGNPDAVNRFTQNLAGLDGVIKNSKLNFSINLLPPKLNKNYSSAVTSIEKEKGDKKDGDESDN